MDLRHTHGTNVLAIRTCYHEDAVDLLAVAGEESVEILQCDSKVVKPLAFFVLGLKATALAWSPRSVSPRTSDEWFIELAVSTHDFGLHILTKAFNGGENVFRFGGGLTGHHGRINDLTFVDGQERILRHLATASDDRNLIVWDLYPYIDSDSEESLDQNHFPQPLRQPTALVLPFAYPLCSVSSHPTTNKTLLVSDSRGSVFIVDWRKDPNELEDTLHCQNVIELVHPRVLADVLTNLPKSLQGCASWRRDDPSIIGSVSGVEYALWDLSKMKGGKPFATGISFPEGASKFRWCPTFPEYFAISSASALANGAVIHINNIHHLQTQATAITIAPRPHRITDFDWIATRGTPRLAIAIGREVFVFPISVD